MTARARTTVSELGLRLGERVRVCGFAQQVRADAGQPRVALRDHTGVADLVGGRDGALAQAVEGLWPESAVEAIGTVEAGSDGGVRVRVEEVHVPGPAHGEVPITETSPLQRRLDWRYLDLRHPRIRLIFEVQTTAEHAMREFWLEHGFLEVHSPKLRPVSNKAGDLFCVAYFDRRAYLVQSPQFYKQMAMAAGFDRVFEVGPAFRADPAVTTRHATEFTSVDVEMSWIDSDVDLMEFEEAMLARTLAAVQSRHGEQIVDCFGTEVRVPATPFPRMHIDEARRLVEATGWHLDSDDHDLDAEGERRLAQQVARAHDHEFVFVTHYPEPARPFYHMRWEEDPVATRSFDLLWKGLEVTSGAQREHRYDRLVAQARAREVPHEFVADFLGFFRHGCPPHGGFGLGLTRMLMSMFEVDDVREVTYLFRGPERISP